MPLNTLALQGRPADGGTDVLDPRLAAALLRLFGTVRNVEARLMIGASPMTLRRALDGTPVRTEVTDELRAQWSRFLACVRALDDKALLATGLDLRDMETAAARATGYGSVSGTTGTSRLLSRPPRALRVEAAARDGRLDPSRAQDVDPMRGARRDDPGVG